MSANLLETNRAQIITEIMTVTCIRSTRADAAIPIQPSEEPLQPLFVTRLASIAQRSTVLEARVCREQPCDVPTAYPDKRKSQARLDGRRSV
jgi:hypothetical protein